jgi:DNA segregation ATPase FtsK/SpoIIIE, S-DNA-T family
MQSSGVQKTAIVAAPLFIHAQISTLEQLRAACLQHRAGLLRTISDLQQQSSSCHESCQQLIQQHETRLRMQEERIASEHRLRCEKIDSDAAARQQETDHDRQRQLTEHRAVYEAEQKRVRQSFENELWVLQSVCDENGEDTPVSHSERFVEVMQSHRQVLRTTLETLDQRITHTAAMLTRCHAGMDSRLPPAVVECSGREECRQVATEQSTAAFALADEIDGLMIPAWVSGWRPAGLFLLVSLILIFPITAVNADLRTFLSPELGTPEWGWLGVSALISTGVSVLMTTIVLVMAQQKLRSRFQTLLQHAAETQAAASRWDTQTTREAERLRRSAHSWQLQMTEQREKRSSALTAAHQARQNSLRLNLEHQTETLDQSSQQQTAEIQRQQQEARNAADAWRTSESQRQREAGQAELQRVLQNLNQELQQHSSAGVQHQNQIIAQWQSDLNTAADLARRSREAVAVTRRWPPASAASWQAPEVLPEAIPAGDLLVALPALPPPAAPDQATNLCVEMPAVLRFPDDTTLVVEHDAAGREPALNFLRAMILKLLTTIPPGRIQLTLIDPVGLGESFAALMHMADFDELLIGSRIWTEPTQIRDRLQKITDHMENVFQTYLRSEFTTIEQYNAAAGEVAEPYHFVVVAGFPAAFSDEAARSLTSILTSGARCGVHTLLTWNTTLQVPRQFDTAHLQNHGIRFRATEKLVLPLTGAPLSMEFDSLQPPAAAEYVRTVRAIGERSRDARRVEVSFTRISPKPDQIWTQSTADGIDLAIGRAGAARLQHLKLGRGTSQHVLIAGKTGSGKSTLLHILVTNLALNYSPDEIQFYLIDFKKGVEFRTYAANHLPHAKVIAIESDREFGLSVLERLDEILQERGDLFRGFGVQDVPAFRRQRPGDVMPRLLLLIDEFQEFFTAEDRVSSRASLLLDRLIRQGRAFGIHVVLGSQTLGGAYSLARSTLGQVAVRIALQCSESDAHLILSEDNSAARLLTRPGEAIYNDTNGMVEGNHPFQIAWLDEDQREAAIRGMLKRPAAKAMQKNRMIVFEGNVAPAAAQCGPLNAWLRHPADATRRATESLPVWLGEPVAIAAPACVEFRRGSGQNLLIVGQDAEMADGLLFLTALSCCHPVPNVGPQMILLHEGRDQESLNRFSSTFDTWRMQRCSIVTASDADRIIGDLHAQLQQREAEATSADCPAVLLVIRNIGLFRSLRREEDDYSLGSFGSPKAVTPASQLSDLIRRGPVAGIHLIIWSDTYSNAMRWLSNSLLREFENRIAFRLNQTDSASLVDSPVAASLGPGRAILYRDQTGTAEKFRPFSWPDDEWLSDVFRDPRTTAQGAGFDIDSITIE